MKTVTTFIVQNKERILRELFDLIRIPSVSTLHDNKETMYKAAHYVKENLLFSGAVQAKVMDTKGWPVVYAEKMLDPGLPTILVYGHYDVQPPEPLEEWISPPFEPKIREGKLFARGADDDKGQLFMQLKAFEFMVKENRLPCNVKFLVEGEEEMGSPSLKQFCVENQKMLSTDVILVSDTTMLSLDEPTITTGLRGLAYFELTIKGPTRDLHSGLYGGTVNNPVNVLSEVIAGMKDKNGRISIPGFYDDALEVDERERKLLNSVVFDEEVFAQSIDVPELFGEKQYTAIERLGIRPSLDVNGIWGGYTGQGVKTILPSKASAKISMRLVPKQTPDRIENLFRSYLEKVIPRNVTYQLNVLHGGNPCILPWTSKEIQAAISAIKKTCGKTPLPVRSGGSIPVIADFEEVLGIKAVLLGFGLNTDAIHSPNENFPLVNLYKGIETIPWFYHFYAIS